ncbi:MAG: hypothetical protein PVG07_13110 [Acidobacteriota bacterium]|jgi:hypothetical protein
MGRLKGILSLVVIAGVFFLAIRVLHLVVPLFYPPVLAGPFSVEELADVEQYTGFSPLTPFYRPEELGQRPVYITAERRPRPRVTVFWHGDRFLYLEQRLDGDRPHVPPDTRPFPVLEDGERWLEGSTWHAAGKRGDLWILLRTDLSDEDLRRIAETLRPLEELL